jgi:glycosyltransferase involved in cell wall biosynthesis
LIKRIIAISNHSFMLGGGEKSFLDLLSHLPEQWDVLAIVPGGGELADNLRKNGIKTKIISLPSIRPWFVFKILPSLKRFFDMFRRYRPALIYANGPRAMLYGGIIGKALKIPVIWHCRIAERDRYLDPLLCRLSTKIIANSQATARRFKSRFQHKVRMVYNGIDIEWLRDGDIKKPDLIQRDWKVILVVARISKSKRYDLALSAFEKIASSDTKLHLVCVGAEDQLDPEGYNYLKKKTKQSQFSNRIHWIGQASDIRPWYKSADILLFPAEKEAFGRVLVEAMACGVPVVATRSGGVPEIVRDGIDGILVTPGDADESALAIESMLSDNNKRQSFSSFANERAEFFSIDKHLLRMTQIFEKVIEDYSLKSASS